MINYITLEDEKERMLKNATMLIPTKVLIDKKDNIKEEKNLTIFKKLLNNSQDYPVHIIDELDSILDKNVNLKNERAQFRDSIEVLNSLSRDIESFVDRSNHTVRDVFKNDILKANSIYQASMDDFI